MRVFLTTLILALPCSAKWTEAQRKWALGTSALLNKINGERFDVLGGAEKLADIAPKDRDLLARDFGIDSREALIENVQTLLADHADQFQIAWNYTRVINIARWGYEAVTSRKKKHGPLLCLPHNSCSRRFIPGKNLGRLTWLRGSNGTRIVQKRDGRLRTRIVRFS